MDRRDIAQLLARIVAYDNRKVDESTITAWAEALDDAELADAEPTVIEHYKKSEKWIMPVHVRRLTVAYAACRRIRAAREGISPPTACWNSSAGGFSRPGEGYKSGGMAAMALFEGKSGYRSLTIGGMPSSSSFTSIAAAGCFLSAKRKISKRMLISSWRVNRERAYLRIRNFF